MYEWLEQELEIVRTPKFHLIDGPVDAKLRESIMQSELPLPPSYKEFILRFGNAKLYRKGRDAYVIGVFSAPRETTLNDGTRIYQIGFHDGATVYVKPLSALDELPIFEYEEHEEMVATSFEEWLTRSCTHARNTYGHEKWTEILQGPAPFTADEEQVINNRRQIDWRVLGVDPTGDHILEVTNAGTHTLRVLTIGARSKDGRLNGAIRLKTEHVAPGKTAILRVDCYKNLVSPHEMELFALPDPQPEDRDTYAELVEK
jgi:hypothetical protein